MSLEAINNISEAEEQARRIKAEATSEAKRMISEAYTIGKAAVTAAEKKQRMSYANWPKKLMKKLWPVQKNLRLIPRTARPQCEVMPRQEWIRPSR